MTDDHPRLRPVQPQPARLGGQQILVLQDPLRLAEKAVCIPYTLAPLLGYLDGTRTLDEIRASLMIRAGIRMSALELKQVVAQFDGALLLENERTAAAIQEATERYREAPFRPPTLAGSGYPAQAEALRALLDSYLEAVPAGNEGAAGRSVRGLISPHIDYQRGGAVYAKVWSRAADAARAADLAIILGTDHQGTDARMTLTRQSYSTPYGVLPTEVEVVESVAGAIGEAMAFSEELHHRTEHSIELAAVWLHHMRRGSPCALVPVLTGSFHGLVKAGSGGPAQSPALEQALAALGRVLTGRRVLVVAAADLAHVGPAFDGRPVDLVGKAQLKAQDDELILRLCEGDAEGFFRILQAEGDRRNVCGLPPIYLALRLLGATRGELVGYDRCPADPNHTSFVSICGLYWH